MITYEGIKQAIEKCLKGWYQTERIYLITIKRFGWFNLFKKKEEFSVKTKVWWQGDPKHLTVNDYTQKQIKKLIKK